MPCDLVRLRDLLALGSQATAQNAERPSPGLSSPDLPAPALSAPDLSSPPLLPICPLPIFPLPICPLPICPLPICPRFGIWSLKWGSLVCCHFEGVLSICFQIS